jgi:hypothetical protein
VVSRLLMVAIIALFNLPYSLPYVPLQSSTLLSLHVCR